MNRYPFATITILFMLGIFLARPGIIILSFYLAGALFLMILLFFLPREKTVLFSLTLAALVVLTGALFTEGHQIPAADDISRLSYFKRSRVQALYGVVVSDVTTKPFFKTQKTIFTLKLKKIRLFGRYYPVSGRVLVNIFRPVAVRYGDLVELEGKLHPPFVNKKEEAFSYRDYLKLRKIDYLYSVKKTARVDVLSHENANRIRSASLKLRNKLKAVFDAFLTRSESGVMKAVILGERADVPKHVKELFLRTGTAHVLAISGLHIGAVSLLFLLVLRFFPVSKTAVNIATLGLLLIYLFLTGGRPSVIRASIMIGVLLLGEILERRSHPLNNLALAAFIILLINPLNLFDIGFQLSFICVLSILLIVPRLKKRRRTYQKKRLAWVLDSLIFSASIWIGVAGMIVYYFQILTPISIAANIVVIPLISLVVFLGFGLMLSAALVPVFAPLMAACLKLSLNLLVVLIFLFDQLPYTHFFTPFVNGWYILSYYMLLMLGVFFVSKIDKADQV